MKKSTKAALFSALIFPGAGQFLLKKKALGCGFAISAGVAIYYIMSSMMTLALSVTEQVINGDMALDENAIQSMLGAQSANATSGIDTAWIIFLVIWVLSILDAYRSGLKKIG